MAYNGAGPIGGSGSTLTIKQVKLERESKLRIEVFTWYGATIEMDGATETDYTADEELAGMIDRQFTGNAKSRASGMVINTTGWIEGIGYDAIYLLSNPNGTMKLYEFVVIFGYFMLILAQMPHINLVSLVM
ncbi:hypothetical protein JHK82_023836 [Glycine max]|nr:hypothetical protein JHK86_023908 [Glycine max]KAG5132648.1 hypothetical protein JHK82_023836 [Glycine max]